MSPSHAYAVAGTYTVTLTVTDDQGATGTTTRTVTPTAPPANQPPTASFTSSCTQLTCSSNASASSDPDGTVASYAWDFGDGLTGTGVSPSHAYAVAGTYTVTLTVTDDQGATGTTTRTVSPTSTAPTVLASDAFSRTATGGWGTADAGGAWTTASGASSFSVSGGTGNLLLATAGSGPAISMTGVSSTSTDVVVTASTDKAATGGGVYVSVLGRRIAGQGDYRAKVRLLGTGQVSLALVRTSSTGAETSIRAEATVPGLTASAGTQLRIRLQVTGTNPTTVRARVWVAGTTEPTTWTATATDATAALQSAGGLGLMGYLSGTATNAPVVLRFDDLVAVPAP